MVGGCTKLILFHQELTCNVCLIESAGRRGRNFRRKGALSLIGWVLSNHSKVKFELFSHGKIGLEPGAHTHVLKCIGRYLQLTSNVTEVSLANLDETLHICRVLENNWQVFLLYWQRFKFEGINYPSHLRGGFHVWIRLSAVTWKLKCLLRVLNITDFKFEVKITKFKMSQFSYIFNH